jgi:FkbM family methyltransferase
VALRTFVLKARLKLTIFVLEAWLRPERPPGMLRFGTFYGGWWIPEVDPASGPAFCVGAGTDVTFDLELMRLGYTVHTADPTPSAVEYVQREHQDLSFFPVGVWSEDGELEFAQDETWDESWAIGSGTVSVSTGTVAVQRFPVLTVRSLMEHAGETRMGLLKLDIEGAEHAVLEQMVGDGLLPKVLCIEFDDHRMRRVIASTRMLQAQGYTLLQIEGLNYIFVRDAAQA